jgi:hypothetical protein
MLGFSVFDVAKSPIEGGSGNVEFLVYFKKTPTPKNYIKEDKIKSITRKK